MNKLAQGYNTWAPHWNFGDASQLVDAGLNTVRVQFVLDGHSYENQIEAFHKVMLPDCQAAGLDIILNIWDRGMNYHAIEVAWRKLFKRYDHRSIVVSYDLVNEPKDGYMEYIPGMVRRLRRHTKKTFIIQPGYGSDLTGFATLEPVNDDNVVYSFHAYMPYPFTCQGLNGKPTGLTWPGEYYGRDQDASSLANWYSLATEFQDKYGFPMFVGEVGCSKFCMEGDAEQWIRDNLAFFESKGWGWCVHSFNSEDFPARLPLITDIVSQAR